MGRTKVITQLPGVAPMTSRRALALLVAVLAVASLAAFLAYRRFYGAVAVVEIKGYILTGEDADYYTDLLLRAYRDDWVKAVVLVVDSFGGSADYVEQVYYNVKQVKQRKPVVALAVNALSGGYYVCVAADYIYAHPTSLVGSVGVVATAPPLLVRALLATTHSTMPSLRREDTRGCFTLTSPSSSLGSENAHM